MSLLSSERSCSVADSLVLLRHAFPPQWPTFPQTTPPNNPPLLSISCFGHVSKGSRGKWLTQASGWGLGRLVRQSGAAVSQAHSKKVLSWNSLKESKGEQWLGSEAFCVLNTHRSSVFLTCLPYQKRERTLQVEITWSRASTLLTLASLMLFVQYHTAL